MLGDKLTRQILTDWRNAPINEKLRGVLDFLVKLTNAPERIGPHDIASLQKVGVSEPAIIDATYVCVGFNIINRIADAMDFEIPQTRVFVRGAWFMRRFGYRMMSGSWPEVVSSVDDQSPKDPYESMMKRLHEAVFFGPGALDASVRQAIGAGAQVGGALDQYVNKIAQRDYNEIDTCIAALRSEGYSDDQIFEATISAAVGAGVKRLQIILQALRGSLANQAA